MSMEALPKTYDFKSTEQRLYHWWEERGYFKPHNQPQNTNFDAAQPTYVISIPPPNVTGELHLGHAMFVSMEDLMIRYHRMRGKATLWVPGSDHAGIATQLQVEKALAAEGSSREQVGREAFIERAWAWKNEYGGKITNQLRRLGASCDWERERFTLDEGLSRAVREAFVRLYEKGLIYRGPRLINWSPGLKTAVSDLEVEYSQEPGTLYYFKYRLKGTEDFIPVATTRPETILGDTALAVHPEDERYARYVGQSALVPMLDREIPVIADEYVDREFGAGALKITPGHDLNDYEIGQRHNLPVISILDRDANVTADGGPYAGLERFAAREQLWADMRAAGLTIREESYMLNVPRTQRGGEIVEPMISTQWFVSIKPLAAAALAAVRDGRIHITPARFEKTYFNWLENIRDWCISRQLWWGHRIPVWYAPDGSQFCARSEAEAYAQARAELGAEVTLEQDADVLDTWFSSGLWPFSTLGWPQQTADLNYFYPTAMLETGYDILFFWVARMIMMGLELTGEVPFHEVYLHGLVRDKHGRKMSKTLGNVIDPLQVMDEYGTDALRFTLLTGSTPGNDMNLSLERVKANRNFANKIWNAARYVIGKLGSLPAEEEAAASPPTLSDRWILARLDQTIADCTRLIGKHQYGQAGSAAYEFVWSEYADWYLEVSKQQLKQPRTALTTARTLVSVLDDTLRLLHPYVPFVTEEIWQHLKTAAGERFAPDGGWPDALIVAPWPEVKTTPPRDDDIADFTHLMDIVRAIRNARSENGVDARRRIAATIIAGEGAAMLAEQREALAALAQLAPQQLEISAASAEKPAAAIALVVGSSEIYLPLAGMVDAAAERSRLEKEIAALQAQIKRLQGLLGSPFAEKAPPPVVQKERDKLADYRASQEKLEKRLTGLD